MFLLCSCIHSGESKKDCKINNELLNNLLSIGQIENLVSNNDTLQIFIDLSSCIHKRFDKINFFRKADTLHIQPEIAVATDKEKKVKGLVKKYSIPNNDTLSFAYFISKLNKTLPNKPDSFKQKSKFITIGVRKKWGLNYYSGKMTEQYFSVINVYLRIMNRIYHELDEYKLLKFQLIEY